MVEELARWKPPKFKLSEILRRCSGEANKARKSGSRTTPNSREFNPEDLDIYTAFDRTALAIQEQIARNE